MSVGKSDIGSLGQKSEQKKEQSYEPENESEYARNFCACIRERLFLEWDAAGIRP